MPEVLASPTIVPAAGEPPKEIAEFMGNASTGDDTLSVARMRTEGGWVEPAQVAEFDELTYVVSGEVHVEHDGGVEQAGPGQAVLVRAGERVRFSTPVAAEYVAICVPAFAISRVQRDG
jgi:ethanolamine utilization protein EutQ (cupin superfamily)